MGNWANLLLTFFWFVFVLALPHKEIGLSFQYCFQKLDFYGWEFSLKMITFGSRSQKGDRKEGSIVGTKIFFFLPLAERVPIQQTSWENEKKNFKVKQLPSNVYLCHSKQFHKYGAKPLPLLLVHT